ncbi:MAG: helix-turn-helix domain-containing protein [Phycisphaerales bacterium]|nr:helix-turn-helix domain-containing protein [Phycisphaerales bacterium]
MDPVSIQVDVQLSPAQLEAIARRAAEIVAAASAQQSDPRSPYLTIAEAAEFLRTRRQRVDDLLSERLLTRVKDGGRTLIARAELEAYLRGETRRARRARLVDEAA